MKDKIGCLLLYYLAVGVTGGILAWSGIGLSRWQFWVILICLIVSHITGREAEQT